MMEGNLSASAPFMRPEVQTLLRKYFGKAYTNVGKYEIEPFLLVLQAIKCAYKDNREVWKMLLQHLYDYLHYKEGFRLPKQKVETYISILLQRHPKYAECLLANLPTIKVPLVMPGNKIPLLMSGDNRDSPKRRSMDLGSMPPAMKRQRMESQFYNFSTPAVNAYLASQGKPTRVVPSPLPFCSKASVVHVPAYSILSTACNSRPSNSQTTSTTAMGNPNKMTSSSSSGQPSPSLPNAITEQQVREMVRSNQFAVNNHDMRKPEFLQQQQLQLKRAIHRIHLQRRLEERRQFLNHSTNRNEAKQPTVFRVVRAQGSGNSSPLQKLKDMVDRSGNDSEAIISEGQAVQIKEEPVSPPPSSLSHSDELEIKEEVINEEDSDM